MSFRFLAPAQTELLEAIAYYAEINAELGVRFEQAIAKAVRATAAHPQRGAPRSRNTRRWLVQGFPLVSSTKTAQARYSSSQQRIKGSSPRIGSVDCEPDERKAPLTIRQKP